MPDTQIAEVTITLPDGATRTYATGTTVAEVAGSISKSLLKRSIGARIDGEVRDLSTPLTRDSAVAILSRDDEEALDLIRHDAAHVMAEAVQELFPGTQVTIGPSIENGFYYDFARDDPFTPEDLETIEAKMRQIIARNEPFVREEWDRDDAIKHFEGMGEAFKAELIRDLPASETISIYRQGKWHDLCRGPHLPSTGHVGTAFKLQRLAGAYWRGDSDRDQLQRIYGTAWRNDKELKAHLTQLEEAAKRDHRRLGREMNLFHLQQEAVGSIFWHPKGWTIYRLCEAYMRRRLEDGGYVEVKTPQLIDRVLWERSGHWEKFREAMFVAEADESRTLAVKPMNCPGHVQIFNQGIKSFRDLPLRMAEFGSCHRNESSGSMHGIMRVRAFTQDDAHIFSREDQITDETRTFCELLLSVYKDFGFDDVVVKFSDRPDIRAGSDETWDKAEGALREAIEAVGLPYTMNPGEGAFYGPKLEFVLKDAIGRDWQCGTFQVDFVLPERLDANYIGEDGEKHRPVMLHRAILGSFERFLGILIENYAGRFPLWLAPVQTVVATITSDADDYAVEVAAACKKAGLRVETDIRNEKINYKVREHSVTKAPTMLVVGKREAEEGTVALRRLGGRDQEVLPLADAIAALVAEGTMPGGEE
jgi:threonyl-tRNA synthetase